MMLRIMESKMRENSLDSETKNNRFILDMSFFIIMNVIWLNIIFGIIIDAFADLRD